MSQKLIATAEELLNGDPATLGSARLPGWLLYLSCWYRHVAWKDQLTLFLMAKRKARPPG